MELRLSTLSDRTDPSNFGQMKTTIDIPDDLYSQARELATSRGQQVATLITEGLQQLVVAQSAHSWVKIGGKGEVSREILPPGSARWLKEWRALGQQNPARTTATPSAAEVVSRMRR